MVMSGQCLHFMGLVLKIRVPWHPKSASIYNHPTMPIRLLCMDSLTCTTFSGQALTRADNQ